MPVGCLCTQLHLPFPCPEEVSMHLVSGTKVCYRLFGAEMHRLMASIVTVWSQLWILVFDLPRGSLSCFQRALSSHHPPDKRTWLQVLSNPRIFKRCCNAHPPINPSCRRMAECAHEELPGTITTVTFQNNKHGLFVFLLQMVVSFSRTTEVSFTKEEDGKGNILQFKVEQFPHQHCYEG